MSVKPSGTLTTRQAVPQPRLHSLAMEQDTSNTLVQGLYPAISDQLQMMRTWSRYPYLKVIVLLYMADQGTLGNQIIRHRSCEI
jgi:hypothetical protein